MAGSGLAGSLTYRVWPWKAAHQPLCGVAGTGGLVLRVEVGPWDMGRVKVEGWPWAVKMLIHCARLS